MTREEFKVSPVYSLKFQLCAGAIALLGLALASVSYFLIEHQKQILKEDLQKTIILQGRNVALSSVKAMFRSDPEFELVPLVTRISEGSKQITSLVITDADNTIQADMELQNIGQQFKQDSKGYQRTRNSLLSTTEELGEGGATFFFKTPVTSLDNVVGFVCLSYSKHELAVPIQRAMRITLLIGAATFVLGIIVALMVFRRISHPLDVVVKGVNSIGRGNLDTRIQLATRNEFRFLAQSFNTMASDLQEVQAELVEKKLVDRELEIAHDIQDTLIPSDIRQPDGYEINIYYKSATQVGGDYVDVMPVSPDRIALVMADVSGKGIPGLVVMAMLKIMVHELLKKGMDPKNVMRKLNTSLAANVRKNMFVTMFLGVLDLPSRELICSNAAHNPLILYEHGSQRCESHRITGRPLALFPDDVFCERLVERRLRLHDGDLLFLYTDGLNESLDADKNQLGHERIVDVCREHATAGATNLITRMVEAERAFRGDCQQSDDLSLLAVRTTAVKRPMAETIEVARNM
jgi:serine phosphatase RsbU (regulator of sigma subunit)